MCAYRPRLVVSCPFGEDAEERAGFFVRSAGTWLVTMPALRTYYAPHFPYMQTAARQRRYAFIYTAYMLRTYMPYPSGRTRTRCAQKKCRCDFQVTPTLHPFQRVKGWKKTKGLKRMASRKPELKLRSPGVSLRRNATRRAAGRCTTTPPQQGHGRSLTTGRWDWKTGCFCSNRNRTNRSTTPIRCPVMSWRPKWLGL